MDNINDLNNLSKINRDQGPVSGPAEDKPLDKMERQVAQVGQQILLNPQEVAPDRIEHREVNLISESPAKPMEFHEYAAQKFNDQLSSLMQGGELEGFEKEEINQSIPIFLEPEIHDDQGAAPQKPVFAGLYNLSNSVFRPTPEYKERFESYNRDNPNGQVVIQNGKASFKDGKDGVEHPNRIKDIGPVLPQAAVDQIEESLEKVFVEFQRYRAQAAPVVIVQKPANKEHVEEAQEEAERIRRGDSNRLLSGSFDQLKALALSGILRAGGKLLTAIGKSIREVNEQMKKAFQENLETHRRIRAEAINKSILRSEIEKTGIQTTLVQTSAIQTHQIKQIYYVGSGKTTESQSNGVVIGTSRITVRIAEKVFTSETPFVSPEGPDPFHEEERKNGMEKRDISSAHKFTPQALRPAPRSRSTSEG